jgi:hypothetical protein
LGAELNALDRKPTGGSYKISDEIRLRVVKGGSCLGFAAETLEGLRVPGQVVGEEFQGDEAAESGVFGLVDHAHASAAELFEDAVVGDSLIEQREPLRAVEPC